MVEILTDLSTPALARAVRQNLYAVCWELRDHWKQAVFEGTDKQRRWWTPVPMAFIFNAALSMKSPNGDEKELIRETIEFFQSRGQKDFGWWLAPGLEDSDWDRQLKASGFTLETDPPGMAVELDHLPESVHVPDGYEISRVEDAGSMKTWTKTFIDGYGLPPDWEPACLEMMLATLQESSWMSYLVTVNDQPVAASSLYYNSGVAGIYNVATLKGWRGKGLGAAATLRPLLEAREQGYRAGILQSSSMGYPVYQRLGFKEVCRMNNYYWEGKE